LAGIAEFVPLFCNTSSIKLVEYLEQ